MLLNGSVLRDADVLTLLEKYRPGITALQTEIVGRSKVSFSYRHLCNGLYQSSPIPGTFG
jgi:hypothetical protein